VPMGCKNVSTLFFMLGWDLYGYNKMCARTCCTEVAFLHPVGSCIPLLLGYQSSTHYFSCPGGWAQYGFHKKRIGTHYTKIVFLLSVGSVGHVVHSIVSGARNIDALFFMLRGARRGFPKNCARTHNIELVLFASNRICGSRGAFRSVRSAKCRCTIFHAQVGPVQFP
jgi:hypothetical protein